MKTSVEEALASECELDDLDFKQAFDPDAPGDWLQLIKDLVAMANSGGGMIIIGCLNNGQPVGVSMDLVPRLDPSVIGDKIHCYTGVHLGGTKVLTGQKSGKAVVLIQVPAAEYPIPFTKVGTYVLPDGKQKTAFNQGNLYFRHAAKSEPANADDLRRFVDQKLNDFKEFWLSGIRKVVEAPRDSVFAVLPSELKLTNSPAAIPIRVTADSAAKALSAPMVDVTHPYRQKEVIEAFNNRINGAVQINAHHLLCVRRAHNIHRDLKYCYNMNWSSPRYSEAFIEWLIEQYRTNSAFFEEAKVKAEVLKSAEKPPGRAAVEGRVIASHLQGGQVSVLERALGQAPQQGIPIQEGI